MKKKWKLPLSQMLARVSYTCVEWNCNFIKSKHSFTCCQLRHAMKNISSAPFQPQPLYGLFANAHVMLESKWASVSSYQKFELPLLSPCALWYGHKSNITCFCLGVEQPGCCNCFKHVQINSQIKVRISMGELIQPEEKVDCLIIGADVFSAEKAEKKKSPWNTLFWVVLTFRAQWIRCSVFRSIIWMLETKLSPC